MKNSPIEIDVWRRKGHSILWDGEALAGFCQPEQAISIRQFFRLGSAGWPNIDAHLVKGRALVIAGLEGCLDSLDPTAAVDWMEERIYPLIVNFQKEVGGGGGEAALIFWVAESKRFDYRQAEQAAYWKCSSAHSKQEIPLGRCLWNGSEPNSQEIRVKNGAASRFAGYYLQRIT
jgi:hypothetical protein